ncbi:MAG: hypothetical protein ACRDWI_09165 [Jiangellaceae bacterium]
MSKNFLDLITSPEMRHAHQVGYSIRMISDIATEYDAAVDRGEYVCARSMLDALYVHVRLLADFLVKTTKGDKDFGPADFDVECTVPTTAEAKRLGEYWDIASQYVVHFGRPRVPENLDGLKAFEVSGRAFKTMAGDVLRVFAGFLQQLEAQAPP